MRIKLYVDYVETVGVAVAVPFIIMLLWFAILAWVVAAHSFSTVSCPMLFATFSNQIELQQCFPTSDYMFSIYCNLFALGFVYFQLLQTEPNRQICLIFSPVVFRLLRQFGKANWGNGQMDFIK